MKTTWGIVFKAFLIVLPILGLKMLFHLFNFEIISVGPVITALLAGVFFVLAIILSGILTDFKESEKLPGELAVSIETLFDDFDLIAAKESVMGTLEKIRNLTAVIISNFEMKGRWQSHLVNNILESIDEDIKTCNEKGVPISLIVKFRNEMANIRRISNRIEIIKETSFLPAGQTIAEFSMLAALLVLMLLKFDPSYEGMILIGVIATIFACIVLLIKDMDDPFEGFAKVDLKQVYKLSNYLNTKQLGADRSSK